MNRSLVTLALVASLLFACTSASQTTRSAGQSCTLTADCAAGLSCIALGVFGQDGGCSDGPKACSNTCNVDTDCASLGPKFKCFAGCTTAKSCGQTQ